MSKRRRGRRLDLAPKSAFRADINITPLVDVVLVLLIIFMVVTPADTGSAIDIPPATNSERGEGNVPMTVAIDAEGGLYLEGQPTDHASLGRIVSERRANGPVQIKLEADVETRFAHVRILFERLRTAGADGVSLATKEPGK